uniref:Uncharacterized protein n=1 Tax=Anguilla anguilla TaxID=7936 RepID=A0A0E9SBF1_ANGAN
MWTLEGTCRFIPETVLLFTVLSTAILCWTNFVIIAQI